ncbi:hypothetical protein RND81_06G106900 [Saponaria officinalis]|uniref:Dof zinc finger protein n=1 Tax=Saponaria officinalis TaxID=3572 RepID=A0AAW1K583_SAPOF
MDHHQQQQNRRRAVEAGGGGAQNHPPSQPCPRCNSNNTKFCYYNNYSLSQPRYFCKGCRRYWTQGGTLRNVPVGGGCRKSKRPKLAPGTTSTSGGGGSETGTNPQLSSLPQPLPILNHQLILNAQDHRLSMMGNNNHHIINSNSSSNSNINNNINNNITSTTTNTSGGTMMMSHNFFGGGNSGFLPSLMPPMQGVNQPLSFGPNLGLLHGFGLPNFDPQPVQPPPNQDESLPSLYSTRELGSSSSIQDWNLSMTPGPDPEPVDPQVNNNSNSNDDNNNENSQSNQHWSNFMGTSGLDDP